KHDARVVHLDPTDEGKRVPVGAAECRNLQLLIPCDQIISRVPLPVGTGCAALEILGSEICNVRLQRLHHALIRLLRKAQERDEKQQEKSRAEHTEESSGKSNAVA